MATLNAKRMLHREPHSQSMEAIENHCNTETGKDSAKPKSYKPISLICHMYKLYKRLILNRIAPLIDRHLIKEQAGVRPGKSYCNQLLNLTQHIEDGYQRGMITGVAFVDLSAAYDTVNHSLLTRKLITLQKTAHYVESFKICCQVEILCWAEQRPQQMEKPEERLAPGLYYLQYC